MSEEEVNKTAVPEPPEIEVEPLIDPAEPSEADAKEVALESFSERPAGGVETQEDAVATEVENKGRFGAQRSGLEEKTKTPIGKKIAMGIGVAAIVGVVLAGVILILSQSRFLLPKEPEESAEEVASGDGTPQQELVEQHIGWEAPENEIVTLETDAMIVSKLQERLAVYSVETPLGAGVRLYQGNWNNRDMIDLTLVAMSYRGKLRGDCHFDAGGENALERLKARYEKMILEGVYAGYYTSMSDTEKLEFLRAWYEQDKTRYGCVTKAALEAEVRRIFGKSVNLEAELDGNKRLGNWGYYAAENQELYNISARYGSSGATYHRQLVKAEKDGDKIFLYERTGVIIGQAIYRVSDWSRPVFVAGLYYGVWEHIQKHLEVLEVYKWTFTKQGSNYILTGVEKQ